VTSRGLPSSSMATSTAISSSSTCIV
jgi:hypothetical protein